MDKNVKINAEKTTLNNFFEKMSVGFLYRLGVPVMKSTNYIIFPQSKFVSFFMATMCISSNKYFIVQLMHSII